MSDQEKQFGEEPEIEKKKEKKRREAGFDAEGKPSADAMRRWLIWAGAALFICAAVVCALAAVSSGHDKKAAVIMEVEEEAPLKLILNRKGAVLEMAESDSGSWDTTALARLASQNASLEESCEAVLETLSENVWNNGEGAALFTIRAMETGSHVDMVRMTEEISVYTERFLRKKQAKGTVYVGIVEENENTAELSKEYGSSAGKSALVQDLIDNNIKVRSSDSRRLCGLSMGKLSKEIEENQYKTSFIVVTAGKVYQVKTEETAARVETSPESSEEASEEEAIEETTAPASESGTEGTGNGATEASAEETTAETETESRTEAVEPERQEETRPSETEEPETSHAATQLQPPETASPEVQPPVNPATGILNPETTAPETAAPETAAPETVSPETAPPETTAPKILSPVETVPIGTLTPETTAEVQPPETTVPPESRQPWLVGPGFVEEVVPVN